MPYYQKLGEMPRKHHIWFITATVRRRRYKNEGIAYEHVITTEGFNEAYSIMYHLRPPTRVRNVKALEMRRAEESQPTARCDIIILATANIPRERRSLHRSHSDSCSIRT